MRLEEGECTWSAALVFVSAPAELTSLGGLEDEHDALTSFLDAVAPPPSTKLSLLF